MRIRLLHIDECPNWADAEVRLRAALNELGLSDTPVAVELLATPEDTIGTAFAGSPTIEGDGTDLFPSDGATNDLACRVYRTPTGLAGLSTQEQIVEALNGRV